MGTSDDLTGSEEDHSWLLLLENQEHERGSRQTSNNVVKSQQRVCDSLHVIRNSGFPWQQKEAMTMKNETINKIISV